MKRIEAAHHYDIPLERGFAFITGPSNWPKYWPGYVRLEEGSRWLGSGDTAHLVTRLFGRERTLAMTIQRFEENRLITYHSTQPGLPDAYHERHFEPDRAGFLYRLVVEYEPRAGIAGLYDRTVLAAGIRRAFKCTFHALERALPSG
jgi:Polyketide cyclase / dehydrase and lipid transport